MRPRWMRILTEPKNAIVKQYEKLFELDDVQLTFEPEALKEVAKKSAGAQDRCQRSSGHYGAVPCWI